VLLSGCSSVDRVVGSRSGTELAYGDVQVIQKGLTAAQVLDAFGPPNRTDRTPDGKVSGLEYSVTDPAGDRAWLRLRFDAREVLVEKQYTGAVPK
jgi:hypothetical protein